jgi:hypothetical protein
MEETSYKNEHKLETSDDNKEDEITSWKVIRMLILSCGAGKQLTGQKH